MQYVNGVQIGSICDLCSLPCNTCNVSAIRCLSCVTGYFYLAEQFRCLAICPQGYYANVNNCLACDANCV